MSDAPLKDLEADLKSSQVEKNRFASRLEVDGNVGKIDLLSVSLLTNHISG